MTAVVAVVAVVAGAVGLGIGALLDRAAGGFPWQAALLGRPAVRPPVVEVLTGALFALTALRFGLSWELPAFLFLAAAGVLLAVIDLQHQLLPDRVVFPSLGIGAVLLAIPAALEPDWPAFGRAVAGAAVLFAVFLVMALVAPSGLFMGDVKLAAVLGLYLGWLGWGAVVVGAVAGFVVQALVALVLLAARRVGRRSAIPFGPALLVGAGVAIGWAEPIVRGYLGTTGRS